MVTQMTDRTRTQTTAPPGTRRMNIGDRVVGDGNPTYVIAELGINHGGDFATAKRLVDEAVKAGVDAVKFQTYITEKRVPKDSPIHGVLKKCELSHESQLRLKDHAESQGVTFFSTPFDVESVDFLVKAGVPLFKIASFDIVNLALLRAVGATKQPVIVSRGMANRPEIDQAVEILRSNGSPHALLHCISAYPTPSEQANLNVIRSLAETYACPVGYSDHTLGTEVPVLAVAAGARIIEKHFTLDRSTPGPDHALSADPKQMAEIVRGIRRVETLLGSGDFTTYEAEKGTLVYRRKTA